MRSTVNPIPRRQTIWRGLGLLGDSLSGNCHTIGATVFGTEVYGYAAWIAARTGLFPNCVDNQGKVGDHTGQFLARLPAASFHPPPTCGCCHPEPMTARLRA
ncbi:hypothetical protein [Pseudomonas syringae]|uniref:hypothetical protein n=1 Tax=Pseudomonas syringae TaxID=317 RepID=UPI001FCE7745|nr:hypothetical protein [Pseudomonas syringae]